MSPSASPGYTTRALEVHDFAQIWKQDAMRQRLDFMARQGLNTLVLHEPGIVDKIVFPARFLGGREEGLNFFAIAAEVSAAVYRRSTRDCLNPFRQGYLTWLIAEARAAGIDVYLEDKELWFKDFVLEDHPEAIQHGVVCPSQPFWWEEFLPAKYTELFIALPGLAGVVTSFGTGESRLALGNLQRCGCERCRAMDPAQWHRNMVGAMHRPFVAAGKKLVVRDFVYEKGEQDQFARALDRLSLDIVLSLKNTPHDFYPTFPDNPLIGRVGTREQWIEYDVHGQYYGWGTAPSIMIDDLRHRLEHGRKNGVTGFILRTDWEGIQDHSCFETANLINLYAAAMLGREPDASTRAIYTAWLQGEHWVEEPASPGAVAVCAEWAEQILGATWPLVRGILYLNRTVFSDSGAFHSTLEQSRWIGESLHSLTDWSAEAGDALAMNETNARRILAEKDAAVAEAERLFAAAAFRNPGLTASAYDLILEALEFTRWYAEGFRLTTRVSILSRIAAGAGELTAAREELAAFRDRLRDGPFARRYPACVLLDPARLDSFLGRAP